MAKVRAQLKRDYTEGWWIESDKGETSDAGIEASSSTNGLGRREWVLGCNINVANSWREFAYIEEVEDDE